MDLLKKFGLFWAAGSFAGSGDAVLLAVSGGCDSMVMADLCVKSKLKIGVAHCNFGLRGPESDLDEQLVKAWCAAHEVPIYTVRFDTRQKAAEWKKGTQETARDLRYAWFEQIRKEGGYARIATAHHANDNVETLLINLFRGTGIDGLHGIRPVNGNIIRPLLFASRADIEKYAGDNGVTYRNDASNETDDYLRNAVRRNIVPAAEEWFPELIDRVNEGIARFAEAGVLYHRAIEQERKKLIEQRGQDHYIPIRKLRLREPLNTICYELIRPFGFSPDQISQVVGLMAAESGHFVASQTHRIIRHRDFLVIASLPEEAADMVLVEAVPCTVDTGKYRFTFSIKDRPEVIPTDKNEAWLDMKNITFPLTLRKWRAGDYFYPLGMKMKKKKVGRLLIDEKMPVHEKDDVRLLECAKKIIWVSGLRIDERFRIGGATQQVLCVRRTVKPA